MEEAVPGSGYHRFTSEQLEEALAAPSLYDDAEKARATTVAYQTLKDELASLYASWEELAEQLTSTE